MTHGDRVQVPVTVRRHRELATVKVTAVRPESVTVVREGMHYVYPIAEVTPIPERKAQ